MCGVVRWGVMWGSARRVGSIRTEVEKSNGAGVVVRVWLRVWLEGSKMGM